MKTNTKTSLLAGLFLSLVACGQQSSIVAGDDGQNANAALVQSTVSLTPQRTDILVAAYEALDPSTFDAQHQAAPFSPDAAFASIDVSSPMPSASAHSTTILVPAGTAMQAKNPNTQSIFYVAYGASTNAAAVNYGPFQLTAQEGFACGGFVANPLHCAAGLSCVSTGQNPDLPGKCEATGN